MKNVELRGITWNHSRALPPLVATAQRFEELHPGVRIHWSKRTLHEFGHADLRTMANAFDLLVIDHPMTGDAESTGGLLDLLSLLTPEQAEDQASDAIGPSFDSYLYHGSLYALPIDAAAPAASFRPDLLQAAGQALPQRWSEVLALARAGWVRMPGFSADLFLNFLGLCVSRSGDAAVSPDEVTDLETGEWAIDTLAELAASMPDSIYESNPIALYEEMARDDRIAYCPFAYTYSNYAREGFAAKRIAFANPVKLEEDLPMRTVLGGTGIAISARCRELQLALKYCLFTSGREVQRSLYGICGGQPARRSAWRDAQLNRVAEGFFTDTADSVERAWVRPRYRGYVALQVSCGELLAAHCRRGGNTRRTLEQMNSLYRGNRKEGETNA
jgi:multiple sugar transport system substrate-binding protein